MLQGFIRTEDKTRDLRFFLMESKSEPKLESVPNKLIKPCYNCSVLLYQLEKIHAQNTDYTDIIRQVL